jgi:hypothetical protein
MWAIVTLGGDLYNSRFSWFRIIITVLSSSENVDSTVTTTTTTTTTTSNSDSNKFLFVCVLT